MTTTEQDIQNLLAELAAARDIAKKYEDRYFRAKVKADVWDAQEAAFKALEYWVRTGNGFAEMVETRHIRDLADAKARGIAS